MRVLAPIGRLLFSLMFLASGWNHLANYGMMAGYAESAGVPFPGFSVFVSGLILLVGGLAVVFGIGARIGAAAIAAFLILAAFTVHHFWTMDDPQMVQTQMLNFLRNLSLTGAALLIVYFGPGPVSVRPESRRWPARERTPLRPRTQQP